MSLEERDNLLGAWAIHCDTPDCHIEVLSISEAEVEALAKSEGWNLNGATHLCSDCASGTSPAEVIGEQLPEPAAAAPEPMIPSVPDHVGDMDESDEDATLRKQEESRLGLDGSSDVDVADLFPGRDAKPDQPPAKKSKPYNFNDAGDTVPDVTAKAEDLETPEDREKRDRRDVRARKRKEDAKKQSKEKTLAAMGGVNALLDDFDGMFGSNKTTWDD